jgi:hypothetical protein
MLWYPREQQGDGRHDNPDLYGCLYLAERAEGAVCEALAPFRGSGLLQESMLHRSGRPLYLGAINLSADDRAIDLDDSRILTEEGLRPSLVATRERSVTQVYASRLFRAHEDAVALRWWSTIEASLINLTLFDRAENQLAVEATRRLTLDDPDVQTAAEILGLA